MPRGVKHLRTLVICGVRVPVIEATAEEIPELMQDDQLLDGWFCGERVAIFVRRGQSATHLRNSITHEAAHAFLDLSGLKQVLMNAWGKRKGFDDHEEAIVRIATPHLIAMGVQW